MFMFSHKVTLFSLICVCLSFGSGSISPSRAQAPEAIEVRAGIKGQEEVQKIVPGSGNMVWFRDADYAPEIVVVPAGKFTMGSPKGEKRWSDYEGPQHEVTIGKPFAVGKYEVTFEEWDACVTDGGCRGFKPDDRRLGRGRYPVINVSWNDAQGYVKWLSAKTDQTYRLLSEAEWEYAARAGTKTRFSFGDDDKDLGEYAWYRDNSNRQTHPVGKKKPNAWGLYDMHGNGVGGRCLA